MNLSTNLDFIYTSLNLLNKLYFHSEHFFCRRRRLTVFNHFRYRLI